MQSMFIEASAWITVKWLHGIVCGDWTNAETAFAEFDAFHANLAEALVLRSRDRRDVSRSTVKNTRGKEAALIG
jgi:hypothetical protein